MTSNRRALRRIERHIKAIQAESNERVEAALREIAKDKRHLRRGDLDAGPLLELIDRRIKEARANLETDDCHSRIGLEAFCRMRGISDRAVQRARATQWITEKAADTICCRLGVPTVCIYPYEQMSLEISA